MDLNSLYGAEAAPLALSAGLQMPLLAWKAARHPPVANTKSVIGEPSMNASQFWALFPVVVGSIWMVVGAVIDGWKLKVPNWCTFPMIICGCLYWATQGFSYLGLAVSGVFIGGALLIIPYIIGGMGAGDVKLYAGFGAWMMPLPWFGMHNLMWAFALSVILGGVMAICMILYRKTFWVNLNNAQDIVNDWKTSGSVEEVFGKARARKPSLQLLPYGVPLTIGSLAYLLWICPWIAPLHGTLGG